jgi:hypothetical protein
MKEAVMPEDKKKHHVPEVAKKKQQPVKLPVKYIRDSKEPKVDHSKKITG